MAIPTYTKAGAKAATPAKLDKTVFDVVPTNHELLQAVYNAYLANGRANLAVTKKRGEVSGGGKKPWRQKGTGRARFGSSRNPIWRGGGIAFGPTGNENYSKHINTKAKRLALKQALSLANQAGKISVIDDVEVKAGKTAELAKLLKKLAATRNTLVVVEHKTTELDRASRNLQDVKVVASGYVNVYDSLNADSIIISKQALSALTARLNQEAK